MKRKDFYFGLFSIILSLHFLGFIVSSNGSFTDYLRASSMIALSFLISIVGLIIVVISIITDGADKKKE